MTTRSKRPVWSGDWKIPKYIVLPGVRVRVKIIPPDEAEVLNGCDGLFVYDQGKGFAVLMIDGSLSLPAQRYALCHELQHAAIELLDIMIENFPNDVRPKSFMAEPVTAAETATELAAEQLGTPTLPLPG